MKSFLTFLMGILLLTTGCKKEPSTESSPDIEKQLKEKLWAHYPLNNDILDKSGNNRILTPIGGLGLSYDMWGKENSCLKFDGINDYAVIEDGKNFPEGDFTVAIKFNGTTLNGRLFQKVDYTNAKGASFGLGFAFPGGNFLHYAISKDVNICNGFTEFNTLDLLKTNNLLADAWYHVVIAHEAGTQKLYLNGQLISSQKSGLPTFKNCISASFNFGIWWAGDPNHFTGKLDDIRIYTRALNEDQIAYLSKCSMQ
jgi:hypothetical protein